MHPVDERDSRQTLASGGAGDWASAHAAMPNSKAQETFVINGVLLNYAPVTMQYPRGRGQGGWQERLFQRR
jgi:hypothetical protein